MNDKPNNEIPFEERPYKQAILQMVKEITNQKTLQKIYCFTRTYYNRAEHKN